MKRRTWFSAFAGGLAALLSGAWLRRGNAAEEGILGTTTQFYMGDDPYVVEVDRNWQDKVHEGLELEMWTTATVLVPGQKPFQVWTPRVVRCPQDETGWNMEGVENPVEGLRAANCEDLIQEVVLRGSEDLARALRDHLNIPDDIRGADLTLFPEQEEALRDHRFAIVMGGVLFSDPHELTIVRVPVEETRCGQVGTRSTGSWFAQYRASELKEGNYWPREDYFHVNHELVVGTVDEIVENFRRKLEDAVLRQLDGPDSVVQRYEESCDKLAQQYPQYAEPGFASPGDPVVAAFAAKRRELDPVLAQAEEDKTIVHLLTDAVLRLSPEDREYFEAGNLVPLSLLDQVRDNLNRIREAACPTNPDA